MAQMWCVALLWLAAALPPDELQALHDIFEAAKLPWNKLMDPCTFQQLKCKRGQTTALSLSALNLTWLPESVGRLQALQNLQLENNRLASLPNSLALLQSLRTLFLGNNDFTEVPISIMNLTSLYMLDLNRNQLSSLPDWLGRVPSLQLLFAQSNQLDALPESIGDWDLEELALSRNRISQLPKSIGQMTSLTDLYLGENQLTSLPESLGQLKGLQVLGLQSNQLSSLPDSIGGLEMLRKLPLGSNRLTSLPESIGQLARLAYLYLESNLLTSLPQSMSNLSLLRLGLDSNRLTLIPALQFQRLVEFRAAKNRLTTLPESFSNVSKLRLLSLHENRLENLLGARNFSNLKVALLHSNRLKVPAEICALGTSNQLKTLYVHGNELSGEIPHCLEQFMSLEVLTLHRNALTGQVPEALARLPKLSVLTLHQNRLYGNLPEDLTTARSLMFFSAHGNRFGGPIPALNLLKDCVNDDSFLDDQRSCDDLAVAFWTGVCSKPEVAFHCPKACFACNNASARGPLLFLHNNRLSCSLPQHVTDWPNDMRSFSLIGNMLGNGTPVLPPWVHEDEHQPFLYFSGRKAPAIVKRAIWLALVCTLLWLLLFGTTGHRHILSSRAGLDLTSKAHIFLLQMSGCFTVLAAVLVVLYYLDATYFACESVFASLTLSNFSTNSHGVPLIEWCVAILWAIWVALGAFFLRRAPSPKKQVAGEAIQTKKALVRKFIYSLCWLLFVALISFPSVAYAVVSAIPFNNTLHLSAAWLSFFHHQAAVMMVLVDMFITPKVATVFSAATGMRRSMLMMAARLGTMWLAAVLSTLCLTTHCMNGWTHLWKVCDETTEDYRQFNVSLGDTPILEPKADLCSAKEAWWSDGTCARSVVKTLAPLLVSKMITRAFLQPIINLLRWQMSYPKDGQLYIFRGRGCTSRSLEHSQQASLLVTMAEVVLLWGALVPILLPTVLLAAGTNMLMCKVGHGHFAVTPVMLDKAEAGMSRRYLHGSLCVLVFFQNWFAWSSGMHGRWLLLCTALLYLGELMGLMPGPKRRRIAILEDVNPPMEG